MDSGTSGGSMQSGSSGEDDQNDTSFSPAPLSIPRLNHHQAAAYTDHLHQQPINFTPQHLQYPPLTNSRDDHMNLYPHLSSNNSFLAETLPQSDLDRVWSMGLNAHPQQMMFYSAATSTSLVAGASSSAIMNNPNNAQTTRQDPQLKPTGKLAPTTTQPGKENGLSSGRVVKKRSRASRKTPTTVLTTDTTNFRAMVQEFTGIPTPPFGPSALFPAKKFDLFGTNNGLDPSLGSLLYSLNKSNNPNPFAPPLSHINTSTNQNTAYQPQQQQQQSQQMMMLPSGSNFQNQNPNQAFHSSVLRPSYPSKYSNAEVDQLAGFSKGGENDNFSGTG